MDDNRSHHTSYRVQSAEGSGPRSFRGVSIINDERQILFNVLYSTLSKVSQDSNPSFTNAKIYFSSVVSIDVFQRCNSRSHSCGTRPLYIDLI